MRVYVLPSADKPEYETGARVVALLARPCPSEEASAEDLYRSLCALALRAKSVRFPEFSENYQLVKPAVAIRGDKAIARDLKTLKRRLRDRMLAAKMAMPLFQKAHGVETRLPEDVSKTTLNQLSRLILEEIERECGHNVERDIFRPSIPGLHLAVAVALVLNELERQGGRPLTFSDIIFHRELAERIVSEAEYIEEALLPKITQFKVNPAEIVRFRLWRE